MRARLLLALAVMAASSCTPDLATRVVTTAAPAPAVASPTSTTVPPPPSHCADYAAMERGEGHPANQDWFNRLDHRGYARVRAACVYGWGTAEWECLDQLWSEESHWLATNGHPRGSYGIPQAYPGTKMAAAGADWQTNGRTQVRWGLAYIRDRYGRPTAASMYRPKRPCHAGY